jgi:hypothetical protein
MACCPAKVNLATLVLRRNRVLGQNMQSNKPAKKPVSQSAIDDLIRKHKGKSAVECDCLKSCMNPKFSRYLFVGLSEGVLHLNLEKMTGHILAANSKTAKDWRARQARKAKRDEAKLAKAG